MDAENYSAVTEGAKRSKLVVLDDWNEIYQSHPLVERLREQNDVTIFTDVSPSVAATLERLAGAEIVVANRGRTELDRELFTALPGLRMVVQTGPNIRHIDAAAAIEQGVLISVTSGGSGASMVEFSIGMIIAAARRFAEQDRALRAGVWPTWVGQELEGKTLGIVGLGHIGRKVAKIAQILGMRVLAAGLTLTEQRATEAGAEYRDLESLFSEADIVSLHLALSERTRGLITAAHLARMKPTAYLINTARGALVDEGALIGALRSRRIAGAALDVYHQEPLPAGHPLLLCENALLTAHCGWVTDQHFEVYLEGIVENVAAYRAGRPIHVANPEARPDLSLPQYQRH